MAKMKRTRDKSVESKSQLSSLVDIAGKPNRVEKIVIEGWRGRTATFKCFYWWLTTKGVRAGDWQTLLVMSDKARDLELDVSWCVHEASYRHIGWMRSGYRCYRANHQFTPCGSFEVANCVCVWILQETTDWVKD